jgi:hypothetical protein
MGRYVPLYEVFDSELGLLSVGRPEGSEHVALVRSVALGALPERDAERLVSAAVWGARVDQAILPLVGTHRTAADLHFHSRFVEGAPLAMVLARGPITAPIALRIALDVLEALEIVHAADEEDGATLRFGGVSPDSIWVGVDGRTRLFEVGISSVASTTAPWSHDPLRVRYRAPESLEREVGPAGDVFAVGALLWEMLAGKPLLGEEGYARTLAKLRSGAIARLAGADEGVVGVVAKATARDPKERHAGATAMATALEGLGIATEQPMAVAEHLRRAAGDTLAAMRTVLEGASDEPPTRPFETASAELDDPPTLVARNEDEPRTRVRTAKGVTRRGPVPRSLPPPSSKPPRPAPRALLSRLEPTKAEAEDVTRRVAPKRLEAAIVAELEDEPIAPPPDAVERREDAPGVSGAELGAGQPLGDEPPAEDDVVEVVVPPLASRRLVIGVGSAAIAAIVLAWLSRSGESTPSAVAETARNEPDPLPLSQPSPAPVSTRAPEPTLAPPALLPAPAPEGPGNAEPKAVPEPVPAEPAVAPPPPPVPFPPALPKPIPHAKKKPWKVPSGI